MLIMENMLILNNIMLICTNILTNLKAMVSFDQVNLKIISLTATFFQENIKKVEKYLTMATSWNNEQKKHIFYRFFENKNY